MRYIDADILIESLREDYDREGAKADDMAIKGLADASVKYGHGQFCFLNAIERVRTQPAADVAPKSEVERLTVELDAMRGAANTYKMHYENARKEIDRLKDYNTGVAFKHYFDGRKEVAREIFDELEILKQSCVETELFRGAWFDMRNFEEGISELKKKYTEEKE